MDRREFLEGSVVASAFLVPRGLEATATFEGLNRKVEAALRARISGLRDLPSIRNTELIIPTNLRDLAPDARAVELTSMFSEGVVRIPHQQFSHHWVQMGWIESANSPEPFPGGITVRDPKGYGIEAGVGSLADGVTNTGFLSLVARHPNAENEFKQFRGKTNADSHGLYLLGDGYFNIRYVWGDLSLTKLEGYILGNMIIQANEIYIDSDGSSSKTNLTGRLLSPSFQLNRYNQDGTVKSEPLGIVVQVEASVGEFLGVHTGLGSFSEKVGGLDEFAIGWAYDRD